MVYFPPVAIGGGEMRRAGQPSGTSSGIFHFGSNLADVYFAAKCSSPLVALSVCALTLWSLSGQVLSRARLTISERLPVAQQPTEVCVHLCGELCSEQPRCFVQEALKPDPR